jgi:hypothetical protein
MAALNSEEEIVILPILQGAHFKTAYVSVITSSRSALSNGRK